jgi:hypothetical protein
MIEGQVSSITALEVQAANYFLLTHLGDRFVAADPALGADASMWHIPMLLAYPLIGPVGATGETLISAGSGGLCFTPLLRK